MPLRYSRYGLSILVATVLFAAGCENGGAQETYDVVIINGRVMDPETNFDGVANVGIRDGVILTITQDDISGSETVDASGHVVAPGFIDYH